MKRQLTFRRRTSSFEGLATIQERLKRTPLQNLKERPIWMTAHSSLCAKMCHRIPLRMIRESRTLLPSRQEAQCHRRRSIPREKSLSLRTIDLTVLCSMDNELSCFLLRDTELPKRAKSEGNAAAGAKKEEKPKKKPKKIRTPAWTDRILWYSSRKQLHQLLYGSFTPISVSDHKPVIGTFLMEARKFNIQKVDAALQDARRSVDVEEMASIPRCKLSPTVIETGMVPYGIPKEFTVTIQNTGETTAVYSFIPPNPGRHRVRSPFPNWLSAKPTSGIVKPGKKENIRLVVCIEGGQWGSADELFGKECPL